MSKCPSQSTPSRPTPAAICCEEPFRIFFPLGLAAGVVGLSQWPLFLAKVIAIYPGVAHARLMIEGFLGAFIFGFLGTAGPRLMSSRHLSVAELITILGLYLGSTTAHAAGLTQWGDGLFLVLLILFAVVMGSRFVSGEELPPPNFVLVACGMACALAGAALQLFAYGSADWAYWHLFGGLLLTQGFVLLPVLGVGVFLFPRFLGVPFGPELAEMRKPTPYWKRKAVTAIAAAAAIVASFAVETFAGSVRWGGAIRFAAATIYIATQMPAVLKLSRGPALALWIRVSVWSLLAGLLWPVFLPTYRVAGLHLVMVGGFALATLTVATRVILGHSGQGRLFKTKLVFLRATAALLLTGMLTRVAADFIPSVSGRNAHLLYAALLCIAAFLVWGVRLIPQVFVPDTED